MQRRAALTAAATVSLAAVAVSTGIAVNLGILRSGTTGAGDLALAAEKSPVASATTGQRAARAARATSTLPAVPETEYQTYYQDVAVPVAAPAGDPAPEPSDPPAPAPTSGTQPPGGGNDDGDGHEAGDDGNDDDPDAGAGDGHSPPSGAPATTSPTTRPAAPPTTSAPSSLVTYSAGGAGTVTADVSGNSMSIVSTSPASGWTAHVVRSSGHEVSVEFQGPDAEIKWKAKVENGRVEVEVEYEDRGDD